MSSSHGIYQLQCRVCKVSATSRITLEMHMNGKRHKTKVANMGALRQASLEQPADAATASAETSFCHTCRVSCSGPVVLQAHLQGKRHHKVLKTLKALERGGGEQSLADAVPTAPPQQNAQADASADEDGALVGGQFVSASADAAGRARLTCSLCERTFDRDARRSHLTSYAHRWKYFSETRSDVGAVLQFYGDKAAALRAAAAHLQRADVDAAQPTQRAVAPPQSDSCETFGTPFEMPNSLTAAFGDSASEPATLVYTTTTTQQLRRDSEPLLHVPLLIAVPASSPPLPPVGRTVTASQPARSTTLPETNALSPFGRVEAQPPILSRRERMEKFSEVMRTVRPFRGEGAAVLVNTAVELFNRDVCGRDVTEPPVAEGVVSCVKTEAGQSAQPSKTGGVSQLRGGRPAKHLRPIAVKREPTSPKPIVKKSSADRPSSKRVHSQRLPVESKRSRANTSERTTARRNDSAARGTAGAVERALRVDDAEAKQQLYRQAMARVSGAQPMDAAVQLSWFELNAPPSYTEISLAGTSKQQNGST